MIIEALNTQFKIGRLFAGIKDKYTVKRITNAKLSGVTITLSATVNDKDELLVVASNAETEKAIDIYLKRWKIETMFGFF